ncbi:hypothetical protein PW52_16850 [Tamlana sedimentorum]|uniref:GmrSD restriction endonucleases N-terminal domain-containing protein n=1 Tax=Neotamlana sedimentorum TaxID=1435349 RepID=A0A0D7VW30_9FLAO|nr:DUF262 domain-containing protein [Tamlana sedimentorum]KJD31056.1 hypothetical protein PW52_16850 [Tamlana sedimentorum]
MNDKKDNIIKIFLEAQNRLVFQSSDLSLDSIASMVSEEAINIKPTYQRRDRWDVPRQSALIESFLLNIPVPPIYLAEDEYGKYSVIDGKQRITAIYNFINQGMELESLEKFKELEGYTFNELPAQLNNALKIRPYLRVITLLKQSDPNLKYEVFNRLNTGGIKLLPQEIRNAAYEGEFNRLLIKLSENSFLVKQFNINSEKERLQSKVYKEMIDLEYVLRFFTLRSTWNSFSGNMKNELDNFMRNHQQVDSGALEEFDFLFNKSMEACEIIFGKDAFRRPDGRNELIQGIYDAQAVGLSFFVQNSFQALIDNKVLIKETFNQKYTEDDNFQVSMRQFTSNIKQVAYRIGTMKDIVKSIIE